MIAYLAMRLGVAFVGVLPFSVVKFLGEAAGRIFSRFDTSRRSMVRRHARRMGISDVETHMRDAFAAYGRYWAEALWIRPRRRAFVDARTTDEGLHWLAGARDAGKGVIVALPHLGNWEYAAVVGTRLGLEVVAVAENLGNRRIRDWFVRMRTSLDIGIILATGTGEVIRALEEVIARNGVVALLSDRDLKRRGVPVRFFGEETTLPAGPASLALRTGAPILPAATYFTPTGHHVVVGPPIPIPEEGDRSHRIRVITQLIAEEFERFIRVAPEQWHLLQPNWPSDLRESG